MLLIIKPLALIVGAICVRISAHSFSLIVHPLSLIDVTICVDKLTLSISLVISPLSFIPATIGPQLSANAIAHAIQPLACVCCSVAQSVGTLCDAPILISLLVWSSLRHTFTEHATPLVAIISCLWFLA